jgi:hypothetical protein
MKALTISLVAGAALCSVMAVPASAMPTTNLAAAANDLSLVIWNVSSPHYRRALGASKGERLWRMQV